MAKRLLYILLIVAPQLGASFQSLPWTVVRRQSCSFPSLLIVAGKRTNKEDNDSSENNDDIDISNQDWRAFRAKLVMQKDTPAPTSEAGRQEDGRPSGDLDGIGEIFDDQSAPLTSSSTPMNSSQKWAYDSGKVIEQGAVILGSVEQSYGFGLRQQYFHKAAILVLEHTATFTKGIILNRPTGMFLEEEGAKGNFGWRNVWFGGEEGGNDQQQWRVWFGGDVQGVTSNDPDIVCLHSLQSDAAIKASVEIMNDLQWTTFENAKQLVSSGVAKPTDFWVFAGYAGWGQGQLMAELDRNSWHMVATDSLTLLKELSRMAAEADPRDAGLETWSVLMDMIGKKETVDNFSGDYFDDLMLKEWARESLLSIEAGGGGKVATYNMPSDKSAPKGDDLLGIRGSIIDEAVAAGSLVRASSKIRSPFLLSYQELHKSLILILSDDESVSVGVILNRPSTQRLEIHTEDAETGEKSTVIVPLRFGGETTLQGGQIIWLHGSPELRDAGIGVEIGEMKNSVWICSETDVTKAIGSGLATPDDFMVFTGVTGWTKGDPQTTVNGIQGEIKNGNFEIVPFDKTTEIWSILGEQPVLNELNMVQNVAIANEAWARAGHGSSNNDAEDDSIVFNSDVRVDELGDDALRSWIAAHLLGIGLKDYN